MELFERFKKYVELLNNKDKIAIYYHGFCTDGMCSAIITSKAISRLKNIKIKFHFPSLTYEVDDKTINFIKKNKINKVLFVDLSIDVKPEKVKELENYAEILIIDHHKFKNDLNSKKTIYCHSELIKELDGSKYPASKLTYDLFSKLTNIEDFDWISCIGLVSDMGYETWKEFVNKVQKKYNMKIDADVFNTEIGMASKLLNTGKIAGQKRDFSFSVVSNSESINDILSNKELNEYELKTKNEIDKWIKKSSEAEIYGHLIIFETKPIYRITSTLSTILSLKNYKNKTVIVISDYKDEDKLIISARDQTEKVDLNQLLRTCVNGLENASGGGHIPASAAKIMRKDLNEFKKRLIDNYKKIN